MPPNRGFPNLFIFIFIFSQTLVLLTARKALFTPDESGAASLQLPRFGKRAESF